jgi:hypothetical protein
MTLAPTRERFPFRYRGKKISVSQVDLLLKFKDINDPQCFTTGTPLGDFAAGSLNVCHTLAIRCRSASSADPTAAERKANRRHLDDGQFQWVALRNRPHRGRRVGRLVGPSLHEQSGKRRFNSCRFRHSDELYPRVGFIITNM